MLNTLPPFVSLSRLSSPIPSSRRGGRLSNHNALRHGFFANKNPTSLTHLAVSIRISQPGLDRIPEVFNQAILTLRVQIARLEESLQGTTDLRSILAWHRLIIRLLGLFLRVKKLKPV